MDCSIQGNMAQSGAIQMWNHLRVMQAHLVNNHPWCKIPLIPILHLLLHLLSLYYDLHCAEPT